MKPVIAQTAPGGLGFAERVVSWQLRHGRHGLPWQEPRDPYRVWLSEVMLQQTQVGTVLAYFPRFMDRFPDVQTLAAASEDEVLALWSGLGYYSRARNLHRCAQAVVAQHGGQFPGTAQALQTLPGIGRSTAAAIAAFCFAERVAILDGNVKRVLARVLGFDEDLATACAQNRLWAQATDLLPREDLSRNMPAYTQGLMDLGATVCTQRSPRCVSCPLAEGCVALAQSKVSTLPWRSRKPKRQVLSWWLLCWQRADGAVWLQRRPSSGIWAGLYAPPAFEEAPVLNGAAQSALRQAEAPAQAMTADLALEELPVFKHVLTHRDLYLHPVLAHWPEGAGPVPAMGAGRWCLPDEVGRLGLPAPVRSLLSALWLRAEPAPIPGVGAA